MKPENRLRLIPSRDVRKYWKIIYKGPINDDRNVFFLVICVTRSDTRRNKRIKKNALDKDRRGRKSNRWTSSETNRSRRKHQGNNRWDPDTKKISGTACHTRKMAGTVGVKEYGNISGKKMYLYEHNNEIKLAPWKKLSKSIKVANN